MGEKLPKSSKAIESGLQVFQKGREGLLLFRIGNVCSTCVVYKICNDAYASHLSLESIVLFSHWHMLVMDSRADVPEHAQRRTRQKARGLRGRACTSDDCIYQDRKREDYLGMSEL